jgi:fatty acid-binding protein DegV
VEKVREAGVVENVGVMHGSAPDIEEFLELMSSVVPRDRIHIGEIGATIGVHGGPRVMGVTFQVAR